MDLANLKSEINKLNIGKLQPTSVDLSKLGDVVKNEVVKKTVYDELVKKVNPIQAGNAGILIKKADYNTKIYIIEKKLDHNHSKYITTQEFNKLTKDNFATRLDKQI